MSRVGVWRGWIAAVVVLVAAVSAPRANAKDAVDFVNPFIGTDGTGHVFPGAATPFGMVAPGPDNADRGWSFSSGYQYRAPRILGFSNTHISGAGIPELGDVLLQPAAGLAWDGTTTDFSAALEKKSETATPGFYAVRLPAHGVRVELTASQRVALHRYRFDKPGAAQVMVDLQHGLLFGEGPRVLRSTANLDAGKGEITGTVWSKNWVERQASFVVRFSRPIQNAIPLPARPGDKAARYVLTFDLAGGRVLEAQIALSTVDLAGAQANLAARGGAGFDATRANARAQWAALLNRLDIEGDARAKRIFYSALYRTMIHPSDIADADGRVRGPTGAVIAAPGGRYYSTLSLWDTFRGVHPLLTLVAPERVDGFIASFLAHHQAQGYLPLWTAWGRETWTMIGNPALPVIADAMAKEFRGFDRAAALVAMVETSTRPRPDAPAWALRDWGPYERFGYLPIDQAVGEAVSKTLEYGVGDDAVARAAAQLGQTDIAARFGARAQGWRKLYDPTTRTMRGRDSQGRWRAPFDPLAATSPMNNPGDYTEANAWQYTATPALQDARGFRDLLGGPVPLRDWLDTFFRLPAVNADKHLGQEAMIGQYAHGNEPSHHIAWLYAFSDKPERGHAMVARVARDFYNDTPAGIIGNDDCGQMSAWYVFATLGLYPVEPASGRYVAGLPLVQRAVLYVPGRPPLTLETRGGGEKLAALTLNGAPLDPLALPHSTLTGGGVLRFMRAP
ncbi:MAG: GH92 family glycosyl hydrolase [Caulobacterales bacterium]